MAASLYYCVFVFIRRVVCVADCGSASEKTSSAHEVATQQTSIVESAKIDPLATEKSG